MMRNRNLVFSLALLGSFAFTTGCNSLKKMVKLAEEQELKVDPNPLELHGGEEGEVGFKMSAKLPTKMLKKDTEYEVQVYFANEGAEKGEETFKATPEPPSMTFVSNDYLDKEDENPTLSKDFVMDYDPQNNRGDLYVVGVARKGDKSEETAALPVAKGVITTSLLVKDLLSEPYGMGDKGEGTFAYEAHNYSPDDLKQVYVDFQFDQGSANLRTVEVRDKGKIIDAFVADKNMPEVDGMSTINIKGSHSPEGSETVNTTLSNQRAEVMKDYYLRQMRKYNYDKEAMDSVKFEVTTQNLEDTKPEFFSLIDANATLTDDQKSEVKSVMNSEGDFVSKESELAEKPYYDVLMDEVYPPLRYARTDVYQGGKVYTDAEMASMARTEPEELSESQLLYAASMTPDLDEKIAIYEAAIKKNDSPAAHNNLAAAHLEKALKETDDAKQKGMVTDAVTHLEIARNKKETAEVNYNLGLAYALQGDEEKSAEAINKAIQLGSQNPATQRKLNGAKGVMLIKSAKSYDSAEYKQAVDVLNNAGSSHKVLYNKALAMLLSRDYDKAMVGFDEAINAAPNDAHSHYCKAITGARKGDIAIMAQSLKKAVELDGDLRAKAMKDLEFLNFFNSTEFKDAIR